MKRNLGCFVSCAGGLYRSIENGEAIGVNTIMIHPSPPQRWNSQPFKDSDIEKYNELKKINQLSDKKIDKVYFHGIYLVNLANPDKQKFHLSKLSLVNHLELCNRIKADGVIFHTGSFKDYADGDEKGYERVIYGINWIFENIEINSRKLYLECAAGAGGKVIGDNFEELAKIYEGIKEENKAKIGFCLDTQHMFASGYDLVNNLDNVVNSADKILGLDLVPVIHFNDSKTELGSNKDRHEDLGEGLIGKEAMSAFLNHPKLKDKDYILETPGLKDIESSKVEIAKLTQWAS